MNFSFAAPTPLEYFSSLVQNDDQFPLLEAAASLAQDEYPRLDVQQVLAEVDELTERLHRRIPADASALHRLRLLNQFYFGELKFGGNVNDYYDPDNSYVNAVLQSRRGIPVSLAVIWIELARALGLPACGVGFPGHFMVRVDLPQGPVVIDPWSGSSLTREELASRLEPYRQRYGLPDDVELPLGIYLQAAAPRDIIARMLRNLKEIHQAQADWRRLVAVQDRLMVLLPHDWLECRDRGLAHAELGHWQQAVDDLENYLAHAEDSRDVATIAARVAELRLARG